MPLLNTDDVARNIMDAILTNQEILFIPKIFYFLDFLKSYVIKCTIHYAFMN